MQHVWSALNLWRFHWFCDKFARIKNIGKNRVPSSMVLNLTAWPTILALTNGLGDKTPGQNANSRSLYWKQATFWLDLFHLGSMLDRKWRLSVWPTVSGSLGLFPIGKKYGRFSRKLGNPSGGASNFPTACQVPNMYPMDFIGKGPRATGDMWMPRCHRVTTLLRCTGYT